MRRPASASSLRLTVMSACAATIAAAAIRAQSPASSTISSRKARKSWSASPSRWSSAKREISAKSRPTDSRPPADASAAAAASRMRPKRSKMSGLSCAFAARPADARPKPVPRAARRNPKEAFACAMALALASRLSPWQASASTVTPSWAPAPARAVTSPSYAASALREKTSPERSAAGMPASI